MDGQKTIVIRTQIVVKIYLLVSSLILSIINNYQKLRSYCYLILKLTELKVVPYYEVYCERQIINLLVFAT